MVFGNSTERRRSRFYVCCMITLLTLGAGIVCESFQRVLWSAPRASWTARSAASHSNVGCPGNGTHVCSGHGTCNAAGSGRCSCSGGYFGVVCALNEWELSDLDEPPYGSRMLSEDEAKVRLEFDRRHTLNTIGLQLRELEAWAPNDAQSGSRSPYFAAVVDAFMDVMPGSLRSIGCDGASIIRNTSNFTLQAGSFVQQFHKQHRHLWLLRYLVGCRLSAIMSHTIAVRPMVEDSCAEESYSAEWYLNSFSGCIINNATVIVRPSGEWEIGIADAPDAPCTAIPGSGESFAAIMGVTMGAVTWVCPGKRHSGAEITLAEAFAGAARGSIFFLNDPNVYHDAIFVTLPVLLAFRDSRAPVWLVPPWQAQRPVSELGRYVWNFHAAAQRTLTGVALVSRLHVGVPARIAQELKFPGRFRGDLGLSFPVDRAQSALPPQPRRARLRVTLVVRTHTRKVLNLDALENFMNSSGAIVTAVAPGTPEWPLSRLGPLLAETDIFVVTFGAAMSNALLLRPGAVMLMLWASDLLSTDGFLAAGLRLPAEIDAWCRMACVHYVQVWAPPTRQRVLDLVWSAAMKSDNRPDAYVKYEDFWVNVTEFRHRFVDAAQLSVSEACRTHR